MKADEKKAVAAFCVAYRHLAARMRLRSTVRLTGEQFVDDADEAFARVVDLFSEKDRDEYGVDAFDDAQVRRRA